MDNFATVYQWLDPRDEQKLDSLRAALEERGIRPKAVDLSGLPDQEVLLLVFLSDALLESAGGRLQEVARAWNGAILPVEIEALSASPPPEITRLSPLRLGRDDEALVADWIALSAEQPTDRQLEWRDLAVRATGASAPGLTKQLLGRRELEKAEDLIDSLSGHLVVQAEVAQFVEESRSALRHRRRRVLVAAGIFTVILAVVAALAFLQRQRAVASAEQARAATVRARADRFSRLSEQLLQSDPDLPAIFAHRAYALDPTQAMRESLRRALDFVPRHRSYRLHGDPQSLAGDPRSPFLVLISGDGSASLVSAKSGQVAATAPRPGGRRGIPVAAISDDGSAVALAYDDGLVQVRSLDTGFEPVWSKELPAAAGSRSRSVAWMGEGRLLTTWEGLPPIRVDLDGGRTTMVRVPGFAIVTAAAASPGGELIAVADPSHLAILRAKSLRPCLVRQQERPLGGETLVFDLPAATLVAARQGSFSLQVPIPRRCGVRGAEKPESNAWLQAPGDAAAALPRGLVAIGSEDGEVTISAPPAIQPVISFPAHRGRVRSAATTAGGALATIGDDGWLRVWSPDFPAPSFPAGVGWFASYRSMFGYDLTAPTWRPMLAVDRSGTTATIGSFASGRLLTVPVADLGKAQASYFLGLDSSIRPAPDQPCTGLAIGLIGSVKQVRCNHDRAQVVWSRPSLEQPSVVNSALSGDGSMNAIANPVQLVLTKVGAGRKTLDVPRLHSLVFDRDNRLFGIEGDGTIFSLDWEQGARRTPISLGAMTLSGGTIYPSGRKALLVGSGGQVVLADTVSGRIIDRFSVPAPFDGVIDVELSRGGSLASIIGRSGYWVVDLRRHRLVLAQAAAEDEAGGLPRDAAFLPDRSLLVIRGDEGLARIRLVPWRFLDGDALEQATERLLPRDLAKGELRQPLTFLTAGQ